jgi:hypothetical protein
VVGPGPLDSVTGITATQSTPGSTGATIFNQIDATPPYDIR